MREPTEEQVRAVMASLAKKDGTARAASLTPVLPKRYCKEGRKEAMVKDAGLNRRHLLLALAIFLAGFAYFCGPPSGQWPYWPGHWRP
jgi:hypothetical protein